MKLDIAQINWTDPATPRMHDIYGNECVKRGLEVALSGSHPVMLLAGTRAPGLDLLRAAARIAEENKIPFKGVSTPPCDCGNYGNPKEECRCKPAVIDRYYRKLCLIMKDYQIRLEVTETPLNVNSCEGEDKFVYRVLEARKLLAREEIKTPTKFGVEWDMLRQAKAEYHVDAGNVIAVAKTIAAMEFSCHVRLMHIAEAVQYLRVNTWCTPHTEVEVK